MLSSCEAPQVADLFAANAELTLVQLPPRYFRSAAIDTELITLLILSWTFRRPPVDITLSLK